jgi:NitT/TauT family transport system substrate-binding protein
LIEAQAQAHYAYDQGIFKAHGLDVDVQTNNNGAANSAAVASGDLQIAATSTISVAQAFNRGLPFVVIAPGGIHDSRYPGSGAFVAPDSKIQTPKDLNGKTIAVATAKGLDQLLASALVDKHGGDSSTLKFVELKPVTMVDALLANRVDAAYMDDPEYSNAKARARLIGDGEAAVGDAFVETVWFTTKDWLAKNPDAARRFRDAIYDAGDWAMANPDRAGVLLQQDLKVTQTRGSQRFATRANTTMASYQVLLDAAAKYSLIPATKASDLLWQPH